MPLQSECHLERYVDLLKVLARRLQLDRRLRRLFDSSDLVQETLLKAHQKIGQFHGQSEGELVKWLQMILLNTFRDRLREVSKGIQVVDLEHLLHTLMMDSSARLESWMTDGQSSPDEQAERQETLLRVAAALASLPDNQRDAVILHYLMSTPLSEMAEHLGCTKKAAGGLLYRGLTKLRTLLNDRD